eukprot:Hpha_TRINITY_DN33707_c0_g1::TRINITY_DN33707_c0_g1_i1::g.25186::m.25186
MASAQLLRQMAARTECIPPVFLNAVQHRAGVGHGHLLRNAKEATGVLQRGIDDSVDDKTLNTIAESTRARAAFLKRVEDGTELPVVSSPACLIPLSRRAQPSAVIADMRQQYGNEVVWVHSRPPRGPTLGREPNSGLLSKDTVGVVVRLHQGDTKEVVGGPRVMLTEQTDEHLWKVEEVLDIDEGDSGAEEEAEQCALLLEELFNDDPGLRSILEKDVGSPPLVRDSPGLFSHWMMPWLFGNDVGLLVRVGLLEFLAAARLRKCKERLQNALDYGH